MIDINIDLPSNFLEEEEREGFLVQKKTKEIWAIELDLLAKFIKVCKEYNLNYFAESGTLLGAVRHKGYIPWDDDIDVVMFRKDYIKLCEIASKEFEHPYFFQTEDTDYGSVRGHAQLRNSLTTGIRKAELSEKCRFNQGIFIDIFPMDNVPNNIEKNTFFSRIQYLKNKAREFAVEHHRKNNSLEKNPYYQELEILCQRYNNDEAKLFGTIEYSCDRSDMLRKIKDYETYKEVDFEFLKIKIPGGYNNILTEQYNLWQEFVIGRNSHGEIIFDTDISYKEYLKESV